MVAVAERIQKRLTMEIGEIAADTTSIRSLDWDRDRFDIEFGLRNGTTYNSFIIEAEEIALVDTSHAKFRQLYLDALKGQIDPTQIDYLIISHTEPDHSGLVADILEIAPQITVVGTKVAIDFLENLVHTPLRKKLVKNGDKLDLGNGHILEFVFAPNLHWPDTLFTYDSKTKILFTCDAFGMHYCSDKTYDEDLKTIEADYEFYYECLMAPNARSVLNAMKRMKTLGEISTIATGHGPLLRHNLVELTNRYEKWSKEQTKTGRLVAVFYTSDYGHSHQLSLAIAYGIIKTGVGVEMMDLKGADSQEVWKLVKIASGIVICAPPVTGSSAAVAGTAIGTILAAASKKQIFGLLESGGSDDLSMYRLANQFKELGLKQGFSNKTIDETPSITTFQEYEELGSDMGQKVSLLKAKEQSESTDSDLDRALGRVNGGLYIITATKEEVSSALLTSWVAQASVEPWGVSIAVAKELAGEMQMEVGDCFVLNVLREDNYRALMKHFLKRFAPGSDRFAGINTQTANNGSPVLTDALAYIECRVVSQMECSDHWIMYATVDSGRVSDTDALPAVHHRQVGSHY